MKRLLAAAVLLASATAHAEDEDYGGGSVIFARGTSLYRVDARGRNETEIAQLAAKTSVRALRTDAGGKVLLADLGGKWSWMRLDGSAKTLTELPCADGPAQLSEDGEVVLCRGAKGAQAIVLRDGKVTPFDVPAVRLVGAQGQRRVIWADKDGVWSQTVTGQGKKQLAPEPALRSFLVSPDGTHALGVYLDKVYTGLKETKPAEILMTATLDGSGAKRKVIKAGVPIEWAHDGTWALVQDGSSACIMLAAGGQYKCWRGYTGASISADGRWGLVLGNRDGSKKQTPAKKSDAKKSGMKSADAKKKKQSATKARQLPQANPSEEKSEPSDEPESDTASDSQTDDVEVAPPSGPLALYRTRLEGAFTDAPTLLVKVVDGAAVWVPASARPNL